MLSFFKDAQNKLSNKRLLAFLVTLSLIVDWQHAVWTVGSFEPTITILTFVLIAVGFLSAEFLTKK